MEDFKNFTNLDRLRGTPDYNEAMVNLLFGVLNTAGLFETDEAVAEYEEVTDINGFRNFCNKWDKQHKINIEVEISRAEKSYVEDMETPPEPPEKLKRESDDLILKLRPKIHAVSPADAEKAQKIVDDIRRKLEKKPPVQ